MNAGQVATSAIDALKSSPALLAVILLQFAMIGLIYVVSVSNAEDRQAREMMLLDRCLDKTDALKEELP